MWDVCLSYFVFLSALCGLFLVCVLSCALASCCCSCRGGGVSFAWVVMHVAVSVSSLLLRLASKKAREVPPCACVACLFFSCPVLLLLVHMVVFFMLCLLFLMHVHAQRRRPLGLDCTASCVAALLSQDPSPSGPFAFPWFGSCCPHHG